MPAKPTQGLNQADAADERKEIAKAAEAKAKGGISGRFEESFEAGGGCYVSCYDSVGY